LYSQGGLEKEQVVVNMGTGAFVLYPTFEKRHSHTDLLSGLSDSSESDHAYLLEGTVNGAGSALTWAAEKLGIQDAQLTGQISQGNLLFINTVGGLGSPLWTQNLPESYWVDRYGKCIKNPDSQEAIAAVAQSIIFLVMANLQALSDAGYAFQSIKITGGLSHQSSLCQQLADLSKVPVKPALQREATAKGIAWLASGRKDTWAENSTDSSIKKRATANNKVFLPKNNSSLVDRYSEFIRHVSGL